MSHPCFWTPLTLLNPPLLYCANCSFQSPPSVFGVTRPTTPTSRLILAQRSSKASDDLAASTSSAVELTPTQADVKSRPDTSATATNLPVLEQRDNQKERASTMNIDIDSPGDVNNLRVPQVHLPPRLAPGVAWQHHHRATLQFVRDHTQNKQQQQQASPSELEASLKSDTTESKEDSKQPQQQNPVVGFLSNIVGQNPLVSATPEWKRLQKHAKQIQSTHLRDLLQDEERCEAMYAEHDGVYLDYSRQSATQETMKLLMELAEKQNLKGQIEAMFNGEKINFTEERAVLHTALRADRSKEGSVIVDGVDAVKEVHEVLDQIKEFTEGVRSGAIRGYTGKRLRNIVSVGIGGSYLGPEFLHEVLKTEPEGINAALGYSLRFLANVDPVDVERTCADLDPEETLIVIVSKTFTTAETMLNARTMRQWLWDFMGNDKEVVRKHVVACASVSATEKVQDFGIDTENRFFRFWDWVGGRYSVCSAAGAVPLSLLYGYNLFEKFLQVRRLVVVLRFGYLATLMAVLTFALSHF